MQKHFLLIFKKQLDSAEWLDYIEKKLSEACEDCSPANEKSMKQRLEEANQ